ncbi:MAG: ABC transporter substrate-binding protein [Solirubrobacterales bacterium]
MKKLGTVLSLIGLVVASSIALAACGSSSSSSGGKEGGTLKVADTSAADYIDPQLSYTADGWTEMWNTYIPLLTYKHAEGAAGSQVIPGLAESLPKITNGGKTYTMTLRKGLKYSDGQPVKAGDFEFAVKRMLTLDSGGSAFYTDIVGANNFQKTKKGDIPGITSNDKTGEIKIDLTKPRGTFSNELALLFVAPVPQNTPMKDQSATPIPGTGPYSFVSNSPRTGFTQERNPQWAKNNGPKMPDIPSGHVDKIVLTINSNDSAQTDDVINGTINWMYNPPPPDRYAEIKSKYEGTQFRVVPTFSTYYYWMNYKSPTFSNEKVRQAVNYAVDPKALQRIYSGQLSPTQQILPKDFPGYKKYVLYPYNLQKAKQLVAQSGVKDKDITVWTDDEAPNNDAGAYLQDVLKKIGFNAQLKQIGAANYFTVIGNTSTPNLDIGFSDWFEDYPHPNDFFDPLLNGENILPVNNEVFSQNNDPALNKKIDQLAQVPLTPSVESQYAALDKDFMKQAVWAPYGNRTLALFVSSDIDFDKVIWNPTFEGDYTSFQFK